MDVSHLIQQITPSYNFYKKNKNKSSATTCIEIMWDIGDTIKIFSEKYEIAPYGLFREVYGKSEGRKNTTQKSYITREFQARCYRIRNIFNTKNEIQNLFPTLESYKAFRDAMPFFDNPKYKLSGKEREDLINVLNKTSQHKKLMDYIKSLQTKNIGIKNPRTQKFDALEKQKEIFISFYRLINEVIKNNDYDSAVLKIGNVDKEFIRLLAKNTSALSQDGLKSFTYNTPEHLPSPWTEYEKTIKFLLIQKNPQLIRRFRRLVPSERIVRLADMLYGFLSEDYFRNVKNQ